MKRLRSEKTRELDNERKRRYRLERRIFLINYMGGKCNCCGENDYDLLDFDHIVATTKTIAINYILSFKLDTILEELKKCQLLCINCHKAKIVKNKEHMLSYNKDRKML